MLATEVTRGRCGSPPCGQQRRFDRLTISSVWGDPLSPATWSGAPYRLAVALRKLGVRVDGFHPKMEGVAKVVFAARHLAKGYGPLLGNEQIPRGRLAREHHALQVAEMAARDGVRHILHMGAFDLPPCDLLPSVRHYLYCDQTWWLSLRHRPDKQAMTVSAQSNYEELEQESLDQVEHIFTFGKYVRDDTIGHYGVALQRLRRMPMVNPGNFPGKRHGGPRRLLSLRARNRLRSAGKARLSGLPGTPRKAARQSLKGPEPFRSASSRPP